MSDFGNAPVPGDTGAPAGQPATSAAPAEPLAPSTAPSPATTSPASPVAAPTPQVDPSWLRGRLQETREAAIRQASEQFAAKEAAYQAQLEQIQRQLHALVGVSPNPNAEQDAIRQQFATLFPRLAALEERADDLLGITERSQDMDLQARHYWQSYGRSSMDRLYSTAEKSLGSPLSSEGKRALHAAFTGYVSSSPDLVERYTQDPTIVDEFWQLVSSSLIDPVRRTAAVSVQTATEPRALPQDRPASAPAPRPAPKPADLDERMAGAWQAYQASKKG